MSVCHIVNKWEVRNCRVCCYIFSILNVDLNSPINQDIVLKAVPPVGPVSVLNCTESSGNELSIQLHHSLCLLKVRHPAKGWECLRKAARAAGQDSFWVTILTNCSHNWYMRCCLQESYFQSHEHVPDFYKPSVRVKSYQVVGLRVRGEKA